LHVMAEILYPYTIFQLYDHMNTDKRIILKESLEK
jgi:hypothetical protein